MNTINIIHYFNKSRRKIQHSLLIFYSYKSKNTFVICLITSISKKQLTFYLKLKPMTFPLKSKRDKEVDLNATVFFNVVLEFKIRNNKHTY